MVKAGESYKHNTLPNRITITKVSVYVTYYGYKSRVLFRSPGTTNAFNNTIASRWHLITKCGLMKYM